MKVTDVEQVIEKAKFGKFHRLLLFWGVVIMVFDGYDLTVYGAVVPIIMEEWHLSAVETGMIGSYALIGMMLGPLLFGTMADKIGRKKVILICTFIFSFFMLLAGIAGILKNPEMFGLCRFITGFGLGGVMPNMIALISDYSSKRTRSRMIATIMAGFSIGGVLAATLSIVIIPNFGWVSVFFFGALPLLFLPLLARTLPDTAGFYITKNDFAKVREILADVNPLYKFRENEQFVMGSMQENASPVKSLFTERRGFSTMMFWLVYFMSLLMIYGLNTWLPKLMNEAGFPLGSSLSFLLALNVGATVGAIMMGWLADYWGVKRALILFYFIAAITISSMGMTTNMILLYILVAVAGAATIGTQNLANSYISQFYPTAIRSTGLGWALGIGRIGGIVGPMLGGVLLASSLGIQLNFVVFAIPGIIAALAVYAIDRQPNKKVTISEKEMSTTS